MTTSNTATTNTCMVCGVPSQEVFCSKHNAMDFLTGEDSSLLKCAKCDSPVHEEGAFYCAVHADSNTKKDSFIKKAIEATKSITNNGENKMKNNNTIMKVASVSGKAYESSKKALVSLYNTVKKNASTIGTAVAVTVVAGTVTPNAICAAGTAATLMMVYAVGVILAKRKRGEDASIKEELTKVALGTATAFALPALLMGTLFTIFYVTKYAVALPYLLIVA